MSHTINDVYEIAGSELIEKLRYVIDDGKDSDENIVKWFYMPNKVFKGKSPFEICKEKDGRSQLEKRIMDVLTAAQGA